MVQVIHYLDWSSQPDPQVNSRLSHCIFFPLQKFEQRSKTGWIGHVSTRGVRRVDASSWGSDPGTHHLSVQFQYGPLPLFFAEDQLSYYKVMSDSHGYKHIHLVKDVRMTSVTYEVWQKTSPDSPLYSPRTYCSGQSHTCHLREVGSHLHLQINRWRHVSPA